MCQLTTYVAKAHDYICQIQMLWDNMNCYGAEFYTPPLPLAAHNILLKQI